MLKYDKYDIESPEPFLVFEFKSEGPKGVISKQVRFEMIPGLDNVFNLGFGDLKSSGEINDIVVTDNNDGEKVLATVASAIFMFFDSHPESMVHIEGSTPARIRLYQMRIARHLAEVRDEFHVVGYTNGSWHPFERGINFSAFLVSKRNN
ncbi:MAG TPA: hypothetical protein VFE50_22695 [Cyclobacteriaceae bacterium]|nr:hypothetical protein [Cyclobacteriaceae bacterium]